MSKSSWAVICVLWVIGVVAAVAADKGSYINAVVTGQCAACPAPRACHGGGGRLSPPPIDGCGPHWWKRRA
ncbi:MAG TPA: hypothetical protein VN723_02380 [Rhizomicrobium sp.]|nr:hypothetical protein [Rhizomicrobium sp.]